jgi:flagellar hook-associated protein 2
MVTTATSSTSSSTNFSRITGLASGMDIDGLVKKLMDAERIPLTKLTANRQKLQWKQDDIRSLNVDMKTFSDGIQSMRLQSTFGVFTTTSTDATVATARGTGSGSDSVAQFTNISALATTASTSTNIAGGLGSGAAKIDPAAKLNLVTFSAGAPASTGSFNITALQKDGSFKTSATITYDTSVDSLNTVLSRINSSGIGVTAFYDSGSDKVIMSTNATGQGTGAKALQLNDVSGTFLSNTLGLTNDDGTDAKFMLNGVYTTRQTNTFTVNGIEYSLLKKTGTAASTTTATAGGIAAAPKTVDRSASLDSQEALGNFNTSLFLGASSFTITALQADGSMKPSAAISYNTSTDTLDTIIDKINNAGVDVTASYDSNSGKISIVNNINGQGVGGNALQLSDAAGGNLLTGTFGLSNANGADSTVVNVEAKRDADSIVNNVKDFITKYNTMLDKLNAKKVEPTYRDYQPLTDEQKAAMQPADITAWEAKAKSGSLNNFSQLESAIYGFRNDSYSKVEGLAPNALNQLSLIGITTRNYQDNGKLALVDENKLRAAISNTPDQVTALFTNYSATDPSKNGIAWKLYNRANSSITKFAAVGGSGTTIYDNSSISQSINTLNVDITNFNTKLQTKETAYYAKFTAMETAISNMQSQSSSLSSLLGK